MDAGRPCARCGPKQPDVLGRLWDEGVSRSERRRLASVLSGMECPGDRRRHSLKTPQEVIALSRVSRTVDRNGAISALTKEQRMTETRTPATGSIDVAADDVFAAARWFDTLWNSTAKATSPEEVEWQCTAWGSGRGGGDWTETGTFLLVVVVFDLRSWRNRDGRDELVVSVPLDRFPQVVRLIDRIGEEPESWPWILEEDFDRQIDVAAEVLGIPVAAVADDSGLLRALRIE